MQSSRRSIFSRDISVIIATMLARALRMPKNWPTVARRLVGVISGLAITPMRACEPRTDTTRPRAAGWGTGGVSMGQSGFGKLFSARLCACHVAEIVKGSAQFGPVGTYRVGWLPG